MYTSGAGNKMEKRLSIGAGRMFYDLSPGIARRMGRPPAGYRYIRVAQDILMIVTGTGIVVDAVYDLSNM